MDSMRGMLIYGMPPLSFNLEADVGQPLIPSHTHTHDSRTRTHSMLCKLMYDIRLLVLWALGNEIATAALCNLCIVRPACLRKVASPRVSPSATPYARPQVMREEAASTSMLTKSFVSDAVLRNLPWGTECEIRDGTQSF